MLSDKECILHYFLSKRPYHTPALLPHASSSMPHLLYFPSFDFAFLTSPGSFLHVQTILESSEILWNSAVFPESLISDLLLESDDRRHILSEIRHIPYFFEYTGSLQTAFYSGSFSYPIPADQSDPSSSLYHNKTSEVTHTKYSVHLNIPDKGIFSGDSRSAKNISFYYRLETSENNC